MGELVILMGLQASGKSTFYRERLTETHTLISKDLLRNNTRPERRQAQLMAEALAAGRSVAVDNTNATVAERAALIALGRRYGATITGYWLRSTVGASLARNRQREGHARVPDVAIFARAKQFQSPTLAEGFDTLYTVSIAAAVDERDTHQFAIGQVIEQVAPLNTAAGRDAAEDVTMVAGSDAAHISESETGGDDG